MIIGTFHHNPGSDSFFGTITTLAGTVPVDVFPIIYVARPKASGDSHDQRPDYSVSVHGIEIGSGWKNDTKGSEYVTLEIDSPVLAAPFTCTLVPDEKAKTFQLDWRRDQDEPT